MKISFAVACLLGFASAQDVLVVNQPQDLPTCIADLEAAIPDVEKIIADFKAGNYDQALTDALALVPEVEKAYTDCLSSEKKAKIGQLLNKLKGIKNVQDLPTCIADLEAAIPDVEKIIADFKAGNYDQALTDALALVPEVEKAYTDCLSSKNPFHLKKLGDMQKCIDDVEGLIPGVEKVIADLKAGNTNAAILQLTLLLPKAEAAYADCTGSGTKKVQKIIEKVQGVLKNGNLQDLPTCIADLEAAIPDVEKIIADFKAGNYDQALTDALALVPEVEKAYTDCLSSSKKPFDKKVGDLQKCITDVEGLIPGVEKVIADLKAGNQNAAILQLTLLLPKAEAAYADCTGSSGKKIHHIVQKLRYTLKNANPEDLPTCIADIEGLIPGVEKLIADVKAGSYDNLLPDAMALLPDAEKAYTDCLSSAKPREFKNFKDLPTCIADIEGLIPGVEKLIADVKAGSYDNLLPDAMALLPDAEKAYTDCLSAAAPHIMRKVHKIKKFLSKINVGDLPTCIADLEAAIPDVEKIIADFKAGNYDQALTDALALVPEVEKAYTDCLSTAKQFGGRVKTILKDDPKREYFEKLGAEFAVGFFAGTKVDHFDSIDFYNCLHREPNAVEVFYKADETMKYALTKREFSAAVKAFDELIYFVVAMVTDHYPHSHRQVCTEFQDREAQYGDLKLVVDKMRDPSTTLEEHDRQFFFNHENISSRLGSVFENYVKQEWAPLGYNYASTLLDAAAHEHPHASLI